MSPCVYQVILIILCFAAFVYGLFLAGQREQSSIRSNFPLPQESAEGNTKGGIKVSTSIGVFLVLVGLIGGYFIIQNWKTDCGNNNLALLKKPADTPIVNIDTSKKTKDSIAAVKPDPQIVNKSRKTLRPFSLNPGNDSIQLTFTSESLMDTSFQFGYNKARLSMTKLKTALIDHFHLNNLALKFLQKKKVEMFTAFGGPNVADSVKENFYESLYDIETIEWTMKINSVPVKNDAEFKRLIKNKDKISLEYEPKMRMMFALGTPEIKIVV